MISQIYWNGKLYKTKINNNGNKKYYKLKYMELTQ